MYSWFSIVACTFWSITRTCDYVYYSMPSIALSWKLCVGCGAWQTLPLALQFGLIVCVWSDTTLSRWLAYLISIACWSSSSGCRNLGSSWRYNLPKSSCWDPRLWSIWTSHHRGCLHPYCCRWFHLPPRLLWMLWSVEKEQMSSNGGKQATVLSLKTTTCRWCSWD